MTPRGGSIFLPGYNQGAQLLQKVSVGGFKDVCDRIEVVFKYK